MAWNSQRFTTLTLIGACGRPLNRLFVLIVLLLVGCGGDDEPKEPSRAATETAPTAETETETRTGESTETAEREDRTEDEGGGREGPEDQPGGAGDEEPARSQALLTGRDGRITPRLVRVPPYISIRVELRSADGRAYGLRFGNRVVRAGGDLASSSTTLDGLRPGRAYRGRPTGAGSAVRIEASAEPGP